MPTESANTDPSLAETVCPDEHLDQSAQLLEHLRETIESLELHSELGRGGMGVVYAATQRSLGRTVAVKTPHARTTDRQLAGMVAEAVITGQLEHPGIVPVHALDLDAEGRPRLILKRIEGRSWADLLAELPAGGCPEDALTAHLDIWLKVAEALTFAHSRGILHRDVKPENVMVGAFGEVYLLDWGVAAAFDARADARLPRVTADNALAGTPAYMAPEQARGDAAAQGPATDVFLLAAMLYELLAGKRPNRGKTPLAAQVAAARAAHAPLPDTVEPTLAALCMRALSPDPADRPASVAEFAESIARWQVERPALRLLLDVGARVGALEAAAGSTAVEPGALQARFEEIRAALAAIAAIIDAPVIAQLRGRAVIAMGARALRDGEPGVAERHLAIPDAVIEPAIRARLVDRVAALRAEQARAAQVNDVDRGRLQRGLLVGVTIIIFSGMTAASAIKGILPSLALSGWANGIVSVCLAVALVIRRERLGRTLPNLMVLITTSVAGFGTAGLAWAGFVLGVEPRAVYVMQLLVLTIAAAIFVFGVERRAWPGLPFAGLCFICAALAPDQVMWLHTAVNLTALGALAVLTLTRDGSAPRL